MTIHDGARTWTPYAGKPWFIPRGWWLLAYRLGSQDARADIADGYADSPRCRWDCPDGKDR